MPNNNHRIHYLTGCPATYYPIDVNLPEILCGDPDPYDWDGDPDLVPVTCPDCLLLLGMPAQATLHRRREIDQWLSEVGARVIRVTDLGAALRAEAWTDQEPWPSSHVEYATLDATRSVPDYEGDILHIYDAPDPDGVVRLAARAAHLARQALGLTD